MNRRRAPVANQRNFVPGGVYDPNAPLKKAAVQQQQVATAANTTQKPQQQPQSTPASVSAPAAPAPIQQQPKQQQQQQQQQLVPKEEQNVAPLEPPPENPFKETDMNFENSEVHDTNGNLKFKKIFINRKKASVRTKEKRIRQNRRLRKTLIPKNGLMALNELKGVCISEFTVNSCPGGGFTALVTVNNSQYEGRGNSKSAAKNNACEKALRDYIIAKLRENPRNAKGVASSNNSVCNEPMDTSDENTQIPNDDDDVPMINLASFAIYKLFADWESEGYVIPEMHPVAGGGNTSENEAVAPVKEQKKPPIRNELPPNHEAMHPASLLCVMRPGIVYVDKGLVGEKPHVLQSLGVSVDDQEFIANGRSKKLARRNVAALACNALFNTNFLLDIKVESGAAN